MITCEHMTNRITDYLEGTVPRGERIGMWLHLLLCHHCRRYVRQMRRVIDMMGDLAEPQTRPVRPRPGHQARADGSIPPTPPLLE